MSAPAAGRELRDAAPPTASDPAVAPSGAAGGIAAIDGSPRGAAGERRFDGVICFGDSDWWYHNRGHYDMQMMRELSAHLPVLYVNSLGVRMPKLGEGRMFFRRVLRKLRSLGRGLVRVRPNFAVYSPVVAPGRLGGALTRPLLAPQVRLAAARVGIRRPLLWVACPPAAAVVDQMRPVGVVYQRTDAYENFPGADRAQLLAWDAQMKSRADATLYCSTWLMEQEQAACRNAVFIDHGVDYERFAAAGVGGDAPRDVAALPRPRVGFVGGIDAHTFDAGLFTAVARQLPEFSFVLVGACSLPAGWCDLPNVHLLGKRPYEQVAAYMAACDVLIMPWNQNEWIRACNPVKLKEYLAVGRPVVSTPFEELRRYDSFVVAARDAPAFAAAVRAAVGSGDAARLRARVADQTWRAKADLFLGGLRGSGLAAQRRPAALENLCGTESRWLNAAARARASLASLGLRRTLRKALSRTRQERSVPPNAETARSAADIRALQTCSWAGSRAGWKFAEMQVSRAELAAFLRDVRYPQCYYRGRARVQWSLWHYLGVRLLQPAAGDVVLDVGALSGIWGRIVRRETGATVHDVDLAYPPGVRGRRIGADAGRIPLPAEHVTRIASFCAFNCFEGPADVAFVREAQRLLRPGGRMVLAPLCVGDEHVNLFDPAICDRESAFDAGARRVALPGWGNNFGRWYDERQFRDRILAAAPRLDVTIMRVAHEFPEIPWSTDMFIGVFDRPAQTA